jgi:processive 1,2-diacylglycerol beta-glucosyltransferase
MKKILILYTSIGLGHKSIAENMGFHLSKAGYEVKLHDILQLQAGKLVNITTSMHQFINRRLPFIWKWLYVHMHKGWLMKLTQGSRVKVASKNYSQIKKVADEFQPDLVVSTQTTGSAVMQYLKQQGWYKGLFGIGFSDYHVHRFWLYPSADFYLANIDEQKQEMIEMGIAAEKIFVVGVTLKPLAVVNKDGVRQRLGIAQEEKVILIASGSLGTGMSVGWLRELTEEITKAVGQARPIIVCGKNQKLYHELKEKITNPKVLIFGYYSPLAELYTISSIFITKPGGLTVAETLQIGLPLLITHWLPGQEELNYYYLQNNRLIMPEPKDLKPSNLAEIAMKEIASGEFTTSLISNPKRLELTQVGREGEVLKKIVKEVFHEV